VPVIEYFYSAHSAYAYLGSRRLMEIAREAGRELVHRPVALTQVIDGAGSTPTATRTQKFRAYYFGREIERWSQRRGAPVVDGIPTYHRNDTTLSNCALIAGTLNDININALAHAFLEGHWQDDADLNDADTLAHLIASVGLDARELLDLATTDAVTKAYAANTTEAIERSVFGSPTYFLDGDMFYGQDRLEMLENALRTPYTGVWPRDSI
jgi:2-hydroxychromene-2-carboxylate isomerase